MNRIYHLVWNQSLSIWVAVSENAKGHGKSISGRKLIAAALALTGGAFITPLALAAPTGGQISAGAGSIAQAGANTTITQSSQNLAINWQSFGIAANEAVRFDQPNATAIALNRVLGQDPSKILGSLSANGQVFVLNPNGVLFGASAQVNVGGLVASTLNISDADFMAGNNVFSNSGTAGAVVNQGTLTAANGGYIALLAPEVRNEGVISATLGTALLAAGDKVTLNLNNGSLLSYSIDQGALNALADNKHLIRADGGQVFMSAKAANALTTAMVNNTGIIEARTVQNVAGVIKLMGDMQVGSVNVGGTLDASATPPPLQGEGGGGDGVNGGFIETSAAHVNIANDAKVTTAAPQGKVGNWLIDPTDYTIAAVDPANGSSYMSNATLATSLGSGNVTIQTLSSGTGNGDIFVNGAVSWSANNTLTLSAYRNINVNSNITATGNTAGLTLTPSSGSYYLNNGAVITLSGSTPSLTIGGNTYTVINEANGGATALQNMSSGLSGHYALGSNIDASATSTWNAGFGFVPVGDSTTKFTGAFDGLGNRVTGLTINRPSTDYVGLFGWTNNATICNVGLVGGSVSGKNQVGGLVGRNEYGTISNSYSTGSVSGSTYVGGLVGVAHYGSISNAYATGSVSGSDAVGGLMGHNNYGTVSNAYATGNVNGGSGSCVGGLLGCNYGTVSNVYATGSVSGTTDVGGLVGYNNNFGHISNAYATGNVSGSSNVGGLVGYTYSGGTVSNSYWDTQTTGQTSAVGLDNGTTTATTGLTTAQMMQTANMPGLDFVNTWWLSPGNTRPFLRSEYSTAITNAHQLQLMGMNATTLAASYTLAADINMVEPSWASGLWSTTTGFVPVGDSTTNFTGTLDGLGHTISNLTINRPTTNYVGLFGIIEDNAISNVGLIGGSVTGNYMVGGLAGFLKVNSIPGNITNSYSTGSVNGFWYVGGLVGYNNGYIINSYYSTGSVSGTQYVGGLEGFGWGSIDNSYSTGSVSGSSYIGGLAGSNTANSINGSYSTGSVSGSNYVGGLVGENGGGYGGGTVNNSYATGNVSGTSSVGGLVGGNSTGAVNTSYATGIVSGTSSVGGLVGDNSSGTVSNSFWDTQTSGQPTTGIGAGTATGATGHTTAELMSIATFSGWNIADTGGSGAVWRIYEGSTTPWLMWWLKPLTVAANNDTATYNGATYSGGNGVTNSVASPNPPLSGTLAYGGTAQSAVNAGSYTITASGFYSVQQGYDISYVDGTLTIDPATLMLNGTQVYNGLTAYAGANLTAAGVNGETFTINGAGSAGNLSSANVQTGSTLASFTGLTLGSGSGGGIASNYHVLSASGSLVDVTPATLMLSGTQVYNGLTAYAGANLTAAGVNGETFTINGAGSAGNLSSANVQTGSTLASFTGLTLGSGSGGGIASNYNVLSASGSSVNVTAAHLTVTADDKSRLYGQANPTLTTTVSGFVNGETAGTAAGFTGAGSATTLADLTTNVGTAAITAGTGNLAATNYAFTNLMNGTLTINPAEIITPPAGGILPAVVDAITALPGGVDLLPAFSSTLTVAATQMDAIAPPPALANLQYVYVTTTTPDNLSGDIDTMVDGEAVPTKAQGNKSDGFNERLPDAPIQFTGTVLVRNGGINLPSDADDSNERGKKIGNE